MLDDELNGSSKDDDEKVADDMLGELETLLKQPTKPKRYC